jgi:hypothetical protein
MKHALLAPLIVGVIAAAPIARADTGTDDAFWAAAQYWFGSKLTRNAAISTAKTMSDSFRDGSDTIGDEAAFLADRYNVSEHKAGGFVGAAIT